MKVRSHFMILVLLAGPAHGVFAGGADKLQLALVSRVALNSSASLGNISASRVALALDYALSTRMTIGVEVEKPHLFSGSCNHSASRCLANALQSRDWSTKVSLNYHFAELGKTISSFVGVGAGNYYIQDSRTRIKESRKIPASENIDYDFRKYFKRPGVFASLGIKWQANSRTAFFLQTKSSILFEKDNGLFRIGSTSNFTDLLNVSTGIRLNLN